MYIYLIYHTSLIYTYIIYFLFAASILHLSFPSCLLLDSFFWIPSYLLFDYFLLFHVTLYFKNYYSFRVTLDIKIYILGLTNLILLIFLSILKQCKVLECNSIYPSPYIQANSVVNSNFIHFLIP